MGICRLFAAEAVEEPLPFWRQSTEDSAANCLPTCDSPRNIRPMNRSGETTSARDLPAGRIIGRTSL